jgi:hypothetical protein
MESSETISRNKISQWGGTAFMLGSLLFLAKKFNDMSRLFLSRPIPDVISGQNLLLILFQVYATRVSRFGKMALRLFSGGGIVLAVGHVSFMNSLADYVPPSIFSYVEAFFIAVLIGTLLLIVGLIWFGVLNLRQPILGRGNGCRWRPA